MSFNSYGGWFDKTVCVETDTQYRDNIIYLPNKTKPFSGKNLCKHENGQKKSKVKVKDGKKDGKWTSWYDNGQINEEGNFKDDKGDGKWTVWDLNGQIRLELNFKDGKCISEC